MHLKCNSGFIYVYFQNAESKFAMSFIFLFVILSTLAFVVIFVQLLVLAYQCVFYILSSISQYLKAGIILL